MGLYSAIALLGVYSRHPKLFIGVFNSEIFEFSVLISLIIHNYGEYVSCALHWVIAEEHSFSEEGFSHFQESQF